MVKVDFVAYSRLPCLAEKWEVVGRQMEIEHARNTVNYCFWRDDLGGQSYYVST